MSGYVEVSSMNDPTIKVTRLGRGWGVRCFSPSGALFLEATAKTKSLIGPVARNLLRMWDKCGGTSLYAERARFRAWEKDRPQDMDNNQRHIPTT